MTKKSDQQISDRDGPEQIGGQNEQTDCQEHDKTEFSRKGGVEFVGDWRSWGELAVQAELAALRA